MSIDRPVVDLICLRLAVIMTGGNPNAGTDSGPQYSWVGRAALPYLFVHHRGLPGPGHQNFQTPHLLSPLPFNQRWWRSGHCPRLPRAQCHLYGS